MPNLAAFHPQIVHFAIVLVVVGVVFRWMSLAGRAAFTGPAAAVLLLAGRVAAVLAVQSGTDAHGPVERVPGARTAVQEHEEAGHWARNVFLVIAVLEIGALVFTRRSARVAQGLTWASALVGLAGLGAIYKAGDRGGDLVYSYAGGVGNRSGDTTDVSRLLIAGLYHSAQAAPTRHHSAAAAQLFAQIARGVQDGRTSRGGPSGHGSTTARPLHQSLPKHLSRRPPRGDAPRDEPEHRAEGADDRVADDAGDRADDEAHQCLEKFHLVSRARSASAVSIPAIFTVLRRPVRPAAIVTALRGTDSRSARKRINSSLAARSTGGAAKRIFSASPWRPATSVARARGTTCTSSVALRLPQSQRGPPAGCT